MFFFIVYQLCRVKRTGVQIHLNGVLISAAIISSPIFTHISPSLVTMKTMPLYMSLRFKKVLTIRSSQLFSVFEHREQTRVLENHSLHPDQRLYNPFTLFPSVSSLLILQIITYAFVFLICIFYYLHKNATRCPSLAVAAAKIKNRAYLEIMFGGKHVDLKSMQSCFSGFSNLG